MTELIIFDLDGVITSEEAYWDTAGLVLHELLYSPQYWHVDPTRETYQPPVSREESQRASGSVLPKEAIIDFKAHAINSNWDTCYAGVCIRLIDLLAQLPGCAALLPLRPADKDWIASFRAQLAALPQPPLMDTNVFYLFSTPFFHGYSGLELIKCLNAYATQRLGHDIEDIFARYSPSWYFCQDLFQEWYLGDQLFAEAYGHMPAQAGKPGCIYFECPLLPEEQLHATLEALRGQGYTLGIATGRPGQEALLPLKNYGLLQLFAEQHIVTDAEVVRMEAELRARGDTTSLVKPHPYPFLLAANPHYQPGQPAAPRGSFIVVGDTTSDVRGGHAAGALVVAVLTGSRTPQARTLLEQSEPDFIIDDVTRLPSLLADIDGLMTIQHLQFTEREKAELLLQRWFERHMHLAVESVTLTPKATSLNSFNGVYCVEGQEYFFKTHVEEQGILEEYYNADLLYKAGYNIVRPLRMLHQKEQQMVIYPVIRWPVVFDLVRAVETGNMHNSHASSASYEAHIPDHTQIAMLVEAERRECAKLLSIYQATLAFSSAEEHARAPIHQLFWHRLTGGRLDSFYAGKSIMLPSTQSSSNSELSLSFEELLRYRWTINGRTYQYTLGELIKQAKVVLNPAYEAFTVIGHGDAHFGNVFLEEQREYLYFDPAFAGRHSPLLDIVKPFFHNVFAAWMYFPYEVAQKLQMTVEVRGTQLFMKHDYKLSAVRQAILDTKVKHLLSPLIDLLRTQKGLPADWHDVFRLALLCCPLLTINLFDERRIPPAVGWLGLAYAIEMGHSEKMADCLPFQLS